ncbi:predicted protein, partial [Nematostella vectensis]
LHISIIDDQEKIQKKTFTKWMNFYLAKSKPSVQVDDIFTELQDGTKLLTLLEVLSGEKLRKERGNKRPHQLANLGHVIDFLTEKKVKLVNIHPESIVDGNTTIILGLLWIIIHHYQSSKIAQNIKAQRSLSEKYRIVPASNSLVPCAFETISQIQGFYATKKKVRTRKFMLEWAKKATSKASGSNEAIKDFSTSWRTGQAFLQIIHSFRPDLVNIATIAERDNITNLTEAFDLAYTHLNVPKLLEPEDVDVEKPDEKSIMTYMA